MTLNFAQTFPKTFYFNLPPTYSVVCHNSFSSNLIKFCSKVADILFFLGHSFVKCRVMSFMCVYEEQSMGGMPNTGEIYSVPVV